MLFLLDYPTFEISLWNSLVEKVKLANSKMAEIYKQTVSLFLKKIMGEISKIDLT